MLINSLIFVLFIKVTWIHGFCTNYNQESTVGQEQEYWDDYGELTCCDTVYPTLYNYIKCINATLTAGKQLEVDSGISSAKYIKFEFSKLPLVPVGVFTSFSNLSELYLNGSAVRTIHPGAFTGLTNLTELYLQNNNIDKISRGTLNSLRNLKQLDLSNNNLEIIEENSFLGLFALHSITLSRNKLKKLFPDVFDNLNNLENADLSHNYLLEISSKLFLNLIKLLQINLSHNNLTDFDLFFLPNSLKKIDLSSNQLSSLGNWSNSRNLQEINLSNNRLTNIETVYTNLKYLNLSRNKIDEINFPFFNKELTTLDVSHNVIANVNQEAFLGLFKLSRLYLQNNILEYIPPGCFRELNSLNLLNLSSNHIVEFEFGTFSSLATLEILDISNNKLTSLYESSFHTLIKLKNLNINDNFITYFDTYDLLDHVKSLKNISINNNPWNCKFLLKVIKGFQKMNVSVSQGSSQKTENVHGISCFSSVISTLSPFSENETIAELLHNISTDLRKLQSFLNKDFQNSSFYRHFTNFQNFNSEKNVSSNYINDLFLNYFEDGFKNTTFYQYFNQDFSNTPFFKSFNQSFLKLFQDFESFNNNFKNSSLYEFVTSGKLGERFSKHLKDEIKNSSFKNTEISNLKFLKYFENYAEKSIDSRVFNMSEQVNPFKNYFDNDFKNSTFYRLFENYYHKNSSLLEGSAAKKLKSAAYIDNKILYDENVVLGKISELKNVNLINNNLIIVVVIVLVIIMVLLTFSQIKTCFSIKHFKNVKSQANEAVELI